MSKKLSIDIQAARKKDLEKALSSVLDHHKSAGIKQSYNIVQQSVYNLLKKDNSFGVIWLIHADKEVIGFAVLSYGYSLEFGGKDGTLSEFYINESHKTSNTELKVLEQLKQEAKALPISALHLDFNSKDKKLSDIGQKAGFSERSQLRRLTLKL